MIEEAGGATEATANLRGNGFKTEARDQPHKGATGETFNQPAKHEAAKLLGR